ncbi:mu-type opioid receptor isoform X3 [Lacerta agilis]|uniref:mu-type opioid receptor isoform X3 n=1 Tax=Lacerta agilis TaxID=80427 RepID=UPI001419B11E|nr:mu-type opioid receptor isoform X3 [Lacerta agilis]
MGGEPWNQSEPNSTQLSCGGPNSSLEASGGSLCSAHGVSPSMVTAIVIMVLYSVVCVVGLFGNFLVMYVIIRYTKMKTATNIYIFNLALADALATSTLPFQSVNYLLGTWPFGTAICKIVISIDYYNMFTSIFTLCTMSVDRYIAVCHPVKALDFRTPRNAKIVNVCNWIVSSAIGIPVMVMATTKESNGSVDCTLIFSHPAWYWENLLKICVFIFAFIMPVLIITMRTSKGVSESSASQQLQPWSNKTPPTSDKTLASMPPPPTRWIGLTNSWNFWKLKPHLCRDRAPCRVATQNQCHWVAVL